MESKNEFLSQEESHLAMQQAIASLKAGASCFARANRVMEEVSKKMEDDLRKIKGK